MIHRVQKKKKLSVFTEFILFIYLFVGGGILAEPINSHRWEAITDSLNAPSWVMLRLCTSKVTCKSIVQCLRGLNTIFNTFGVQ